MIANKNFAPAALFRQTLFGGKKMFIWCAVLFLLGVMAFFDSLFNMGDIFRRVNSVMFMLISLGLFVRTSIKIKSKRLEEYENRVFNLEHEVRSLKDSKNKLSQF